MNAAPLMVCFAVKEEAAFFFPSERARPDVRVVVTGMGRSNTERRLDESLAQGRPCAVISSGFAGGLRPDLAMGTVLCQTERGTDLEKVLLAAGAQLGRFYCADRVAATAAEKRKLFQRTGQDAVEMESRWIRDMCRAHELPMATARVILDAAEEDLPLDFNLLMNQDQELDPRKLAFALLKRPGSLPGLIRLRKQTQFAARRLGAVLERAVRAFILTI